MSSTDDGQCRALTSDGERCGRPAGDDGFCYQHDESDPVVDDSESDGTSGDGGTNGDGQAGGGGQTNDDGQAQDAAQIRSVRESVQEVGHELIGHELESITGVEQNGDGWRVTVEVVERKAVPDTQDILGRYEVDLDSEQSVSGYRRLRRYRRADTSADGPGN